MQYISPITKDNDIVNKKYVDNIVSEINTELESVETQIGNPENLETEDKSSLVNAINEVKASVGDNFSVVFESEIIFEGRTGDFTKSLDNFDGISFLTNPTNSGTSYTNSNPMFPTKNIIDRLSIVNKVNLIFFDNSTSNVITITNTSVSNNSKDIRVYGHKIKVVLNNG